MGNHNTTPTGVPEKIAPTLMSRVEAKNWLLKETKARLYSTAGWQYLQNDGPVRWQLREGFVSDGGGQSDSGLNAAITASKSECYSQVREQTQKVSSEEYSKRYRPEDTEYLRQYFDRDGLAAEPFPTPSFDDSSSEEEVDEDGLPAFRPKKQLGFSHTSRATASQLRGHVSYELARKALLDPSLHVTACFNAITHEEDFKDQWLKQPFDRVISNANDGQCYINNAFLSKSLAATRSEISDNHLNDWSRWVSSANLERQGGSAWVSISPETFFKLDSDPVVNVHCAEHSADTADGRTRAANMRSMRISNSGLGA